MSRRAVVPMRLAGVATTVALAGLFAPATNAGCIMPDGLRRVVSRWPELLPTAAVATAPRHPALAQYATAAAMAMAPSVAVALEPAPLVVARTRPSVPTTPCAMRPAVSKHLAEAGRRALASAGTRIAAVRDTAVPTAPQRLALMEGRSQIVEARGVRTVQIDDATGAIAEVRPISENEVLVLAKGPGTTTVRIWDARGRAEYEVTVEAGPARRLKSIQDAIGIPTVRVRLVDSTAILEGEVATIEQAATAQRIAEAFAAKVVNVLRIPAPTPTPPPGPTMAEQVQAVLPRGEVTAEMLPGQPNVVVLRGLAAHQEDLKAIGELAERVVKNAGGSVLNLVRLAEPRQVRVQALMLSVDERLLRDLGFRWNDELRFGQPDPVAPAQVPASSFRSLAAVQATIRTLLEDSRTEVLERPSIVVRSGAMGSIQIGGEVPIPVVVTGFSGLGGGGVAGTGGGQAGVGTIGQSVFFRPFGVLLNIEPAVEPGNEVSLRILSEVSSIDRSNSVVVNGASIPGFATRRTLTELRLKGGESLVIGGLISREDAKAVHKFPFLADIPVFGAFFRSVRKEKQARELVLVLTPEPLPGPEPPVGMGQVPSLRPGTGIPGGVFGGGLGIPSGTAPGFGSGANAPAPPVR